MQSTTEKVEGIQKLMEVKMIDVGIEKEKTNELIEVVGRESLIAEKEADAAAVQRGRSIFAGTCAAYCHKLTPGAGDALYLFDCEWKHGGRDQEIFNTISNGVPNTRMIAFGTNFPEGEEDLWKLIAFLKSNRAECS